MLSELTSDEGFDGSSARRISSSNQPQTNPETVPIFPLRNLPRLQEQLPYKPNTAQAKERSDGRETEGNPGKGREHHGEQERRGRGVEEKTGARTRRQQQTSHRVRHNHSTMADPFRLWSHNLPRVLQAKPVFWLLPLPLDLSLPPTLYSVALLLLLCLCTERQRIVQREPPTDRRENTKTKRRVKQC